jgi:hypothetical protein
VRGRGAALVVVIATLAGAEAAATPRYALEVGQTCALCHVDPTGGGQRSLFGAQFFAYTDLAMKPVPFDELEGIDPRISDAIQMGFDVRSLYFGGDEPAQSSFFQMQGDLYLDVRLSDEAEVAFDRGLRDDFELATILHILPATGYVKIGRFTPPYGMRLPDHNAFVRERLDVGTSFKETGLELGFHPERVSAAVSVTNGNRLQLDDGEEKAVTGRIDLRSRLGGVRTWVGVTGRVNDSSVSDDDAIVGAYGGAASGPVSILAEIGHRERTTESLSTYLEIAVTPVRGLTLRAEHHFFDPDVDLADGSENMFVGGVKLVPRGYLGVLVNARYRDRDGPDGGERWQGELLLHAFY